ncbi:MAG: hypothetical protein IJ044_01650, partial [Oscillospiraceae bacterium]|nr:hypothetical protein [Oscillospiraceae bacterium]
SGADNNFVTGSVALNTTQNTSFGSEASPVKVAPGTTVYITSGDVAKAFNGWKISADFTTGDYEGASLVESVKLAKNKSDIVLKLKESYTAVEAKDVDGLITITSKTGYAKTLEVHFEVCNNVADIWGVRKASDTTIQTVGIAADQVTVMDEDGGYVAFATGDLAGTVKMAADEKVYLNITAPGADAQDAIDAYLGEDYLDEAIIEYYAFETRAFKNEVNFAYDAYEEDPHFFYVWDGEAMKAIEAKFNDDEDVMKYEFTAAAEDVIIVTDTEIVLAAEEETKNPDTGANDVVGVAAALAVVSLVAAGAVSLKK